MANGLCKVCGYDLFPTPLLQYPNMPGVAQHLPDAGSVHDDAGVALDIFQCSGCGLVQLDTEPVHYYREVIRAVGVSEPMKAFRRDRFRTFAGRKTIEIGCGRGEYLSLLQEAGADAYGLEWSQEAVTSCTAQGLRVTRGFVEDEAFRIPDGPFDAFVILSFFEHLPQPNAVLRGIRNNLVEGGTGLVEVPNFDMILRGRQFSEFMRDHLFYFTRRTLTTTLEMSGFEVLGISEVWQDYILSATVRKRSALDLTAFTEHQRKLKQQLDSFVGSHARIATWGAGHQAFAILALMGLGGKIRYVVDSAPFKQGKLTPVSHIPIVAPDALRSDPVNAVLIMAGSYSDEIARILREQFDPRLKVAVLRDSGVELLTRD
jgi:SAM-dependent methyltransferase